MKTPEITIPILTGTAVPLGALKTKHSCGSGEYPDLVPFAAFCKKAGLKLIQLLPVNDTGTESSPYSALSAFALHPLYISIESLPEYQSVPVSIKKAVKSLHAVHDDVPRFHYRNLRRDKLAVLRQIYDVAGCTAASDVRTPGTALYEWASGNPWLPEYAVFMVLKQQFQEASWKSWPEKFRRMTAARIQTRWNDSTLAADHLFYVWLQYRAYEQFKQAADAVAEKGILLKGDIPIMMNEDSADAWAHPEFFDDTLRAGSPPDGSNPSGQNWGFPVYRWDNLARKKYSWWKQRLVSAAQFYDAYRIDHVLGFFRIWATPERESTAMLGRTLPGIPVTRAELTDAGFDSDRIRWLSQPHVPTREIEAVNNNDYLGTHGLLHKVMDRLGDEELWLFKKEITGDRDILERRDIPDPVKLRLSEFWRNRTLLEVAEDEFVPLWTYRDTTAWQSLFEEERERLEQIISGIHKRQELLWEKQARKLLGELTSATDMIACAEDLGANPESVPRVLGDLSILRLCVVRWCRDWGAPQQPFVPLDTYPENSVVTSSVHDSSTLRLWWLTEPDAGDFYQNFPPVGEGAGSVQPGVYTPETARYLLRTIAQTSGRFCVHPVQDFLALSSAYYAEDPAAERVNIPGSVTEFNWTYRLPVPVETLSADKALTAAIADIVAVHKKCCGAGKSKK